MLDPRLPCTTLFFRHFTPAPSSDLEARPSDALPRVALRMTVPGDCEPRGRVREQSGYQTARRPIVRSALLTGTGRYSATATGIRIAAKISLRQLLHGPLLRLDRLRLRDLYLGSAPLIDLLRGLLAEGSPTSDFRGHGLEPPLLVRRGRIQDHRLSDRRGNHRLIQLRRRRHGLGRVAGGDDL